MLFAIALSMVLCLQLNKLTCNYIHILILSQQKLCPKLLQSSGSNLAHCYSVLSMEPLYTPSKINMLIMICFYDPDDMQIQMDREMPVLQFMYYSKLYINKTNALIYTITRKLNIVQLLNSIVWSNHARCAHSYPETYKCQF